MRHVGQHNGVEESVVSVIYFGPVRKGDDGCGVDAKSEIPERGEGEGGGEVMAAIDEEIGACNEEGD